LDIDTLIATLGFDADFTLRRLMRGAPGRVVLLALKVDEGSWARVDSAFKLIQAFCSYRRIDCILEPVNIDRPVMEVYSILKRELEGVKERLELFLTGGPRIMVVSTLLAALLLPPEYSRKVKAVVEGEAFTASLEVDIGTLQKLLTLDHIERRILLTLLEHQQGLTAPRIAVVTKTPKTSIYRKLHTLESQGLVKKVDGRYKLEDSLKDLMRILPLRGT
jgi:CRISPR-associated protein Csa3